MGFVRWGIGMVALAWGAACSASEPPAQPPPPAAPDASDANEVGSPDASVPDTARESSPPDAPAREVVTCEAGPFDVATPQDSGCASHDDTDRDGVPDCFDGCPYDAKKVEPGVCGCGRSDLDSDRDGIADCMDAC